MSAGVLAYALLMAVVLGVAHLVARRRPRALPLAAVLALGAGASVVIGLALLGPTMLRQARESLVVGVAWALALAAGLAGVGALFALAHAGLLRGIAAWRGRGITPPS